MLMKKFTQKMSLIVACLVCLSFSTNAATIFSESFGTSLGNFTQQSLKGEQSWMWTTYSGLSYAKITGYVSGANNENDDWLISPPVDFSDVTKANLSFTHAHRYGSNPVTELTLLVSDSYTGGAIDTTKWKSFAFTHSDGASWTFVNSGLISLNEYAGKESVRFAFRYKSSSTAGATWEVNNIVVESVVDNTPKTILEEKFDKVTLGTLASPSSYDLTLSADSVAKYISSAGWTGSKVYSAAGTVKLGSSSSLGLLTTPALDLSANSGNFSISFDARAWSGDATSVKILVNDVLVQQVDGLSNAAAPYTLSSYGPIALTGGTATTKITISGLQAAKGRVFLDNIKITQGGTTPASASLTSEKFSVEVGNNQSKSLKLKAANLTGNLQVQITNNKGTAFSVTPNIVTVTQAQDTAGFPILVYYAPTVAGLDTATVKISGGGLVDPVSVVVSGTAWVPTFLANLAELRTVYEANPTNKTTVYRVNGEAVLSYAHSTGNSKYFQDATGGVLVYDTKGLIKTAMNVGDGVKNLTGTLEVYSGLLEFIPVADAQVTSTGNALTPVLLTVPSVKTNKERYESTLIQVNNLTSLKAVSWGTAKANYNFVNGLDTIVVRTNYTGLDYMGEALPTSATNIAGLLIEYNGTVQLFPRRKSDLGVPAIPSSLKEITKDLTVYGSNGILNVIANQGQVIEVYSIMGRKIMSSVANDGVNTFSLGRNQLVLVKVGGATSKIVL